MSEQSPEKVNTSEAPAETYTLASILAEYKSEAFIRNERRYSKEELEKRAEEILQEMRRSAREALAEEEASNAAESPGEAPSQAEAELPSGVEPAPDPAPETAEDKGRGQSSAQDPPIPEAAAERDAPEELPPAEAAAEPGPASEEESASPEDAELREPERDAAEASGGEIAAAESEAREAEKRERAQAREAYRREKAEALQAEKQHKRERRLAERQEAAHRRQQQREEKQRRAAERAEAAKAETPEPTPEEAMRLYASGIPSLGKRRIAAFAICVLMALTMLLHARGALPAALLEGSFLPIFLFASQVAVLLLGLDVLSRGLLDLFAAKPGAESIVAIANIAAAVDAVVILAGYNAEAGVPYCITAAASMAFAVWGTGCRRLAFRDSIRSMRLASAPTVVFLEEKLAEEGAVLNKKLGSSRGFLRRCTAPDVGQLTYRRITPPLLLLLLVLTLAGTYLSGTGALTHILAGLCCAAAALSSTLVFARPFSRTARKLSGNGAALAGWSGAEDMNRAVGLVIRDLDVFPENTVILNGMKVLSGAHVEKAVAYTGSVILAAGSGLRRVFGELMRQYAAPLYRVDHFDCGTEGGVGAYVGTEEVLVGTAAYMNLKGIRVPDRMNVPEAVFTAIDGQLCCVFVLVHEPQDLIQTALIRLDNGRIRPLLALRDFNLNPAILEQKFRLEQGSIVFLPPEDRYRLSMDPETEGAPAALLSREGLWHYSETARSGRRLRRTTRRALFMTLLGVALGVLITFISFARGAFSAVEPGKLLIAMLLWAFATMMIADAADGD